MPMATKRLVLEFKIHVATTDDRELVSDEDLAKYFSEPR